MASTKEVFVGLLFFGGLIALGLLTIVLSDFNPFKQTFDYDIYFDQANELKVKDEVLIMGTLQGKVRELEFYEEPLWDSRNVRNQWVRVKVRMDIPLVLKEDYSIRIRNASILGGKVMDIRLGQSNILLDMEKTRLGGLAVRDPVEAISEFIEVNKAPVRNMLEKLDNLVTNVSDWSDQISKGEGTLGRLIQSDAFIDMAEAILEDISTFAAGLNRGDTLLAAVTQDPATRDKFDRLADNIVVTSDRLASGEGTLGKLFKNEELYNKALATVDNVEGITGDLKAGRGFAGKLLSEESEAAYGDFSHTLANVSGITDAVVDGPGLVHAVIYDEDMKNSVNNTFSRFDEISTQIRDLIADVQEGKGALGKILKDEEFSRKLDKLLDAVIGSIEDAREAAPLMSLGSFLFGAI